MQKELTLNKIAAALVGVAMVAGVAFAFTATRAHAATLAELVDLFITMGVIPADKADQARTLAAGQETTTPAAPAMTCNFTRNLTVGDTGADVMDLQKLLNGKGFTVAASGAGSAGMETQYFGPATKGAVAKMQEAFASEILTPLGLTAGTGYFGASTRAKANTLCAAAPAPDVPGVPGMPGDDDEEEEEEGDEELSGEASLDTFEINSADDDTIDEGAEDATIAEAKVTFADGDARISRIDVTLVSSDTTESDPWDTFETISVWVDGDMVAEKDIDSRSDYLDDDEGTVRLSGLDIVAMEDDEMTIVVAVTVAGSVDGTDDGNDWTVSVDSMRYTDADDVTTTEDGVGDLGDSVSFTVEEAGSEDELIVKNSTSDPASSILKAEDDSKSDWLPIFVFDLDTDDSVNDITLNSIPVTVLTATTTTTLLNLYSTLVDDARLVIDGTTIDSSLSDIVFGTTTAVGDTAVITFDVDGDVVIDAGDRVKAELQVRLKALASANEGALIQGMVTSTNAGEIDAEGADDLDGAQEPTGSATGEQHQIYTTGIYAKIVSTDEDTKSNGTVDDSVGEFTIKFDVSAFEDTYYISATDPSVFDVDVLLNNSVVATATPSVAVSSTATKNNGVYRVDEGDTETFTLTITVEPDFAGNYIAVLNSVDFGSAEGTPTDQDEHVCAPSEDFETDPVYING